MWKVARDRPPPCVEEVYVYEKEGERTYAQMLAGTEIVIQFAEFEDAAWLVDGRNSTSWSRVLDISVSGRILRTEWAEPELAPIPWQKLRHQADIDADSFLSYNTAGTKESCSGAFQRMRPVSGEPGASAAPVPLPRTVLLEGLPRRWPPHQVEGEVLALLKNVWRRDGCTFNPRDQLHRAGGDGGIVVRKPRCCGDENDGTCLVKLRRHIDAKWLVEGSAGKLTLGGDIPVRVFWARPRNKA